MRLQAAILLLTASYLALGMFDASTAGSLWAVYALVVFVLTVAGMVRCWLIERRDP